MTLGRSDRAVAVGLDYLRRVGITWSAHPTEDEVRQEYARMWRQLGDRPIEALLDLPRMVDPVACATMDVLTSLVSPALFTDENLRASSSAAWGTSAWSTATATRRATPTPRSATCWGCISATTRQGSASASSGLTWSSSLEWTA